MKGARPARTRAPRKVSEFSSHSTFSRHRVGWTNVRAPLSISTTRFDCCTRPTKTGIRICWNSGLLDAGGRSVVVLSAGMAIVLAVGGAVPKSS
jgi:hypothetical protein